MPQFVSDEKILPLNVAGGSNFGRSPKIDASRTINMVVASGTEPWLVDLGGYKKVISTNEIYKGRRIYASYKNNFLIVVLYNLVYLANAAGDDFILTKVGELSTSNGAVFIAENNANQIALCDKSNLYIYNTKTNAFTITYFDSSFLPGSVVYQDGYFIVPNLFQSQFAISSPGDGTNFYWGTSANLVAGGFQTKADIPQIVTGAPGRSGVLYVIGKIVTELWSNQPSPNSFPYVRSATSNIDYGIVNSETFAASENLICWLAQNERSGPVVVASSGSDIQPISTDGLNYKFSKLHNAQKSYAFFVKLSGHLLYFLTFYDERDNFTFVFDFTSQVWIESCDENFNYHIARNVAFFNNNYYFVTMNNGDVFLLSDHLFTYNYNLPNQSVNDKIKEIPRIRICSNIRTPDQTAFITNNVTFPVEQGTDDYNNGNHQEYFPRIALSVSRNGGVIFGTEISKAIYPSGDYRNKLNFWRLGYNNDMVIQIRFYGRGPFRASNGEVTVYV